MKKTISLFLYSLQTTETYLQLSRTFMMELFCKNSKLLTIFANALHHRLLAGSEIVSWHYSEKT